MSIRHSAIIPSAGTGERMKISTRKQYLELDGKPILIHSLEKFQRCKAIDEIVIPTRSDDISFLREMVERYQISKVSAIIPGGRRRQDSVYQGLLRTAPDAEIIIIHDAVRPFVSSDQIQQSIDQAKKHGVAIVAVRTKDTLKQVDSTMRIMTTIPRSTVWLAQTPQTFQKAILIRAFENVNVNHLEVTDDSSMAEMLGIKPVIVEGSYSNFKITTQEDLDLALSITNRE